MESQENQLPDDDGSMRFLFEEVEHIFSFSERREQQVMGHFGPDAFIATGKNPRFRNAHSGQLIPEGQIKNSCVKYRLRFLSTTLYNGEVPFEVIAAMKHYEHRHPNEQVSFLILAPAAFFLLQDEYKSPLLFAARGEGKYELICEWGKKRPAYREFLLFPMRDFRSLVISALVFGLLVCITAGLLGFANGSSFFRSMIYKVPLLVLSAGSFSTIALIYGLTTHTDFSSDNWNRRYFR